MRPIRLWKPVLGRGHARDIERSGRKGPGRRGKFIPTGVLVAPSRHRATREGLSAEAAAQAAADEAAAQRRRILIGSQRDPAAYRARRQQRDWTPVVDEAGQPAVGSGDANAPSSALESKSDAAVETIQATPPVAAAEQAAQRNRRNFNPSPRKRRRKPTSSKCPT